MIDILITLLLFQAAGEILAAFSGLPIPGPLFGMVLLFLYLLIRGRQRDENADAFSARVLPHLNLLFIPASVGIGVHFHSLLEQWLPIAMSLVASTAAGILVTAFTLRLVRHDVQ